MVFIIAIEGNIGAGKTFLMNGLRRGSNARIMHEPFDAWKNFDSSRVLGKKYNMVAKFYEFSDDDDFNYVFQTYVIPEYVKEFKKTMEGLRENDVLFVERAFYSSLCVFAAKNVDDVRYSVLRRLSDEYVELYPALGRLDGVFYLDTPISVCLDRIEKRARAEEKGITGEYLRRVACDYEIWRKSEYFPYRDIKIVEILDGSLSTDFLVETVFQKIRERLMRC